MGVPEEKLPGKPTYLFVLFLINLFGNSFNPWPECWQPNHNQSKIPMPFLFQHHPCRLAAGLLAIPQGLNKSWLMGVLGLKASSEITWKIHCAGKCICLYLFLRQ